MWINYIPELERFKRPAADAIVHNFNKKLASVRPSKLRDEITSHQIIEDLTEIFDPINYAVFSPSEVFYIVGHIFKFAVMMSDRGGQIQITGDGSRELDYEVYDMSFAEDTRGHFQYFTVNGEVIIQENLAMLLRDAVNDQY